MVVEGGLSLRSLVWHLGKLLCVLLGLALLWAGCGTSDNRTLTAPTAASPQLEQQAIITLLDLYRQALLQEDIDRVEELLASEAALAQAAIVGQQRTEDGGTWTDVQAFRTSLTATFRTRTMTALAIPPETIQVSPDRRSVTFLEAESVEDPTILEQRTRLFRTTLQLTQDTVPGVTTLRIAAVRRDGPLVQIRTPGQVQAGALTRIEVLATATLPLAGGAIEVPETGVVQGPGGDERPLAGGLHAPTAGTPPPAARAPAWPRRDSAGPRASLSAARAR